MAQIDSNIFKQLAFLISPDRCSPSIFDAYSAAWHAAGHTTTPNRMLAIGAFCADAQEQAELLASTAIYRKMMDAKGDSSPLLSPEAVEDQQANFSVTQNAEYDHLLKGYTVGTPERCKTEIDALATSFATNEIAIVTVTYDFAARVESYRLLIDY